MPLHFAVLVSLLVAAIGWRARALTGAGAVAATLVGTAILWGAGVPGLAVLGAFFVGSSAVSRLSLGDGASLGAKGEQRDAWQVAANGVAAAVAALLWPDSTEGLAAVTASLAAAAADTWATTVGSWSRRPPRHILTGRVVQAGASGGITWLGTLGALVGAAMVSGVAALSAGSPTLLPFGTSLGLLGMLADSIQGAGLQGKFHCPACHRATERRIHECGQAAVRQGGIAWLSNDGVNGITTGLAAIAGLLVWRLWLG